MDSAGPTPHSRTRTSWRSWGVAEVHAQLRGKWLSCVPREAGPGKESCVLYQGASIGVTGEDSGHSESHHLCG